MDVAWIETNAVAALLSGIGSLLAGLAAASQRLKRIVLLPGWSLVLGGLTLGALAGVFAARALDRIADLPLNARFVAQAWDAFKSGRYEDAMGIADACVEQFSGAADREQAKLEKDHAPSPPAGRVRGTLKGVILARGLLNDVATCLFIKGRSAEKLGLIEPAKYAYEAASRYTHARTWDPQDHLFWSPAAAALDRLDAIK